MLIFWFTALCKTQLSVIIEFFLLLKGEKRYTISIGLPINVLIERKEKKNQTTTPKHSTPNPPAPQVVVIQYTYKERVSI